MKYRHERKYHQIDVYIYQYAVGGLKWKVYWLYFDLTGSSP